MPARRGRPRTSSRTKKPAAPASSSPGGTRPDDLRRELREALGLPASPRGRENAPAPRATEPAPKVGERLERRLDAPIRAVDLLATGHLVCEGCGRIARWGLPALTQHDLSELALAPPEGWSVRTLSVSFAGYCPSCRARPAP